jgi:acetyl-CoA synthetase
LIIGCTTLAFEGALDHPTSEANWKVAIEEFSVSGLFTSPTAVRLLMRYGDEPLGKVNHDNLERVFCAGEVLNAPAWDWLQNKMLKNRIPVIDHMWQTETGGSGLWQPLRVGHAPHQSGLGHHSAARY